MNALSALLAKDKPLTIKVTIGKSTGSALIDSGASCSLISSSFATFCRLTPIQLPAINLRFANSNKLLVNIGYKIPLTLGTDTKIITVYSVSSVPYDLLLGIDTLSSFHICIKFGPNTEITSVFDDILPVNALFSSVRTRLLLQSPIEIPSRSSLFIPAHSPTFNFGDVIIEPSQSLEKLGISFEPAVVKIKDFTTHLLITNYNYHTVNLPSNLTLSIIDDDPEPPEKLCNNVTQEETQSKLKFEINSKLTTNEKKELERVLQNNSDLFTEYPKDLPRNGTNLIEHEIKLKDGSTPFHIRPYRYSYEQCKAVQLQVDEFLEAEIIRPSDSPYASPYILVKKPDGTWRFCVDLRRLNKQVTHQDPYPLPLIEDILGSLGGMSCFSSLDLTAGYYQVRIKESDRWKTAFSTPNGHFEFNRLVMGLNNAPATFMRLMDKTLGHLRGKHCFTYLDDVIVFGRDFSAHNNSLSLVFEELRKANLKMRPSKCRFGQQSLQFLGHVISKDGILPSNDKLLAVSEVKSPKNIKELRAFLGLAGYYRRFVKGFSTIASPLNDLLKADAKYIWTQTQEDAFTTLKLKLQQPPILAHFREHLPTLVYTDASGHGLGVVLSQVENKKEHVNAYYSRTLNIHEKRYSTTEKECLAIIFALKKCRHYLLCRPFTVITDHIGLTYLFGQKDPSGRIARWSLLLSQFDMKISYRKGRVHNNADALSRLPLPETIPLPMDSDLDGTLILNADQQLIIDLQKQDPFCKKIIDQITNRHKKTTSQYQIIRDTLHKLTLPSKGGNPLMVLPPPLFKQVLEEMHDSPLAGHPGILTTIKNLGSRFYHPKLSASVIAYVKSCDACQKRKSSTQLGHSRLHPQETTTNPFQIVSCDVVGPLNMSLKGNKFIIVGIDAATRYIETRAIPTPSAEESANFIFEQFVCRHSCPGKIITDRGSNFTARMFNSLLALCGTGHSLSTSWNPMSNGTVERVNKTLGTSLSLALRDHSNDWESYLQPVTMGINCRYHETIKTSPFFCIFFRQPVFPMDRVLRTQHDGSFVTTRLEVINKIRSKAMTNIQTTQEKNKAIHDSKHSHDTYKRGDFCLIYKGINKVGQPKKWTNYFHGPYLVLGNVKDLDDTYHVRLVSPKNNRESKEETVNLRNMKRYFLRDQGEDPVRGGIVTLSTGASVQEQGLEVQLPQGPPISQPEPVVADENVGRNDRLTANSSSLQQPPAASVYKTRKGRESRPPLRWGYNRR